MLGVQDGIEAERASVGKKARRLGVALLRRAEQVRAARERAVARGRGSAGQGRASGRSREPRGGTEPRGAVYREIYGGEMRKLLILLGSHIIVSEYRRRSGSRTPPNNSLRRSLSCCGWRWGRASTRYTQAERLEGLEVPTPLIYSCNIFRSSRAAEIYTRGARHVSAAPSGGYASHLIASYRRAMPPGPRRGVAWRRAFLRANLSAPSPISRQNICL